MLHACFQTDHTSTRRLLFPLLGLFLVTSFIAAPNTAHAQTFSVVYTFCAQPNCVDGALPNSSLILDAQGNLYGTTLYGGTAGCVFHPCGTAFKLTPNGTETVLHNFGIWFDAGPEGLIWDLSGNLIGESGGEPAVGVVFEITKRGFRHLYQFQKNDPSQGYYPIGGLVMDAQGNLFGTTWLGGAYRCPNANDCGTVFEVTPGGVHSVLHNFAGGTDGFYPLAGVIVDEQGNLYGTTAYGGTGNLCKTGSGNGCGTVFKLSPDGTETILYTFSGGADGAIPLSGLVRDAKGNLYGTTTYGGRTGNCTLGNPGCGTVFQITRSGAFRVLYRFHGGMDGANPVGGLILDAAGNLYGTTIQGGGPGCGGYGCGTIFKLTAARMETVLHSFSNGADGGGPGFSLVFDPQGNLYGTAGGGAVMPDCIWNRGQCGVVFKLTP